MKRNSALDKDQRQVKRPKLDEVVNDPEAHEPQCTQVPILKHVFEVCFTTEDQDEHVQVKSENLSYERDIMHTLSQKHEERGEELWNLELSFYMLIHLCTSGPLAQRLKNPIPLRNLLKLPRIIDENVKDSDFDFHSHV